LNRSRLIKDCNARRRRRRRRRGRRGSLYLKKYGVYLHHTDYGSQCFAKRKRQTRRSLAYCSNKEAPYKYSIGYIAPNYQPIIKNLTEIFHIKFPG